MKANTVRWPLKNQILSRMLLLLLVTICGLTYANIRSVIVTSQQRQSVRMQGISDLIGNAQFPLTSPVLENMKSLSGAEFVLVTSSGEILERTAASPRTLPSATNISGENSSTPSKIVADGRPFYHAIVKSTQVPNRISAVGQIHIFVPRQTNGAIWWQASRTPLLIASLILPVAFLVCLALASNVTQPLARLQKQVQQISNGEVFEIPSAARNDEIQDLNDSVNEMAVKLSNHDEQLRQNERLKTMLQVGNGVAHHLRNSATGCKMAVALLGREHESVSQSENYQVAIRQLDLMNNYIKKFLHQASTSDAGQSKEAQLVKLDIALEKAVFLLRPSANHLDVTLEVRSNGEGATIRFAEDDAEQLMINLISNAITASSEHAARSNTRHAVVEVELCRDQDHQLTFSVTDNGAGPPEEISHSIFKPFVTGRREGTGLGLSVVRDVAQRWNAVVNWKREADRTVFTVKFAAASETLDAETLDAETLSDRREA